MTGADQHEESQSQGRGLFERKHWPAATSGARYAKRRNLRCGECGLIDHETDAWHCRKCGRGLQEAAA